MSKNNWVTYKMSDILEPISIPVVLKSGIEYREIGIRSHGKGIFHKEITDAETIGNKRVFKVIPNALIFNIVFAWEQAVAKTSEEDKEFIASHRFPQYLPKDNLSNIDFLLYLFTSPKGKYLLTLASPGGAGRNKTLGKKAFDDLELKLPNISEQQKIANILSTWDKAISTTERLIDNSSQQKKALMQQLLTGKKRLLDESGKRFDNKWQKVELGKLLNYEQPTPYLVKSTAYSDDYKTPVLTAGKTFILGYTDEEFGIFDEKLPVIIFDDFTTASKFVDFPFKAKSSAMKMLTAKAGVSIKYIFEAMQFLNFAVGGHQRHWISIFSNLTISLPSIEEQQKIATVLSNADKEIELLKQQLANLQQEKKALMQVLLTGKKRVVVA